MNINEQMQELATMGGLAYAPTDDVISSLLARTKRARATRQSTATLVGTVGALAIGLAAAQAYSAAKDDPAFRDRNIINNKMASRPSSCTGPSTETTIPRVRMTRASTCRRSSPS